MEHPIKDERPDLDEVWPMVPSRDVAAFLLSRIVQDPQVAQNVWNAVVRPLYDLREVQARWPRGRCYCGAVHPGMQHMHPGIRSDKSRGHRMRCRWYTGPLEHRVIGGRVGITGSYLHECSCGRAYNEWADEDATVKAVCPDILFVWRGERPEPQEDAVSEQDEPRSNAEVQEEYGVASDSQVAVEAERERLEKLAEKNQVGPDTSESDTEDEDHEPSDDETADKADSDDEQGKEGESFHQ